MFDNVEDFNLNLTFSCFVGKNQQVGFKSGVVYKTEVTLQDVYDIVLGKTIRGRDNSHFLSLIEKSRDQNNPNRKEFKLLLPSFTWSLKDCKKISDRKEKNFNGVMGLDFDGLDPAAATYLRDILADDPYTLMVFLSPSGEGVKLLSLVEYSTEEEYKVGNKQLADYYRDNYGVEADSKCIGDSGRHCFFSVDERCYLNPEPEVFNPIYDKDTKFANSTQNTDQIIKINEVDNSDYISKCEHIETKLGLRYGIVYQDKNRSNFVFRLACEANRYGLIPADVCKWFTDKYGHSDEELDQRKGTIYWVFKTYTDQYGKYMKYKKHQAGNVQLIQTDSGYQVDGDDEQRVDDTTELIIPLERMVIEIGYLFELLGIDKNEIDITQFAVLHLNILKEMRIGTEEQRVFDMGLRTLESKGYEPCEVTVGKFIEVNKFLNYSSILETKTVRNTVIVSIKDVRSKDILINDFINTNLKPKKSQFFGFEILNKGKYVQCDNSILNGIYWTLNRVYDIKSHQDIKSSVYSAFTKQYNPILEKLNELADKYYKDEVSIAIDNPIDDFVQLFIDHNRLDLSEMNDQQVKNMVTKWCIDVVRQLDGNFTNETALGAISQEEGSGKSMFMKNLTMLFRNMKVVSKATYDMSKVDSKRSMCCNVILHDDELSIRNKKGADEYKEALSAYDISYTEKFETQELSYSRTCSYTFCGNTVEFLEGSGRRDRVIRFNEHRLGNDGDTADFAKLAKDSSDMELLERIWGFAMHEYKNNLEVWENVEHKLDQVCRKTNNQYKRSTFEHEAITQHFSVADDSAVKPMDRVIYDPVLVEGSALLLKNNYANKTVIASANDIIHMIKTLYGENKIVRQRVTTVLREMGLDKTKQYKYGAGNNPKWGFLVKVNIEQ